MALDPCPVSKPAHFVGPWDLNRKLACIPASPREGSIVLVESIAKSRALPYHRKKLVLVLSALRHFAAELEADGFDVEIVRAKNYVAGIRKHVAARKSDRVVAMKPREFGLARSLEVACERGELGAPLELHDDGGDGGHFFLTRAEIDGWMRNRKTVRMHQFYAWMRKTTGYLMDGSSPRGGKYSFDTDNRKTPGRERPADVIRFAPDPLTQEIMDKVAGWGGHWGEVDGFDWPVTRVDALRALESFFESNATKFGEFQDAMVAGEPYLWHARISAALNLSLLSPKEVCDRTVEEFEGGRMPLASAEGFLRQVLGWREFMRGVYWLRMPELREANGLQATRPLPKLYWQPELTELRCLRECASQVLETGYAHHIQRLMVLGNFALLAELAPIEVSHWFWAGFVDAYEWVELPNVHGMALFADETFTTKPYAASGSYINRMSDYCSGCRYNVKLRTGDDACPFNSLFWRFMNRHRPRLEKNPRLRMLYRTWDKFSEGERDAVLGQAERFLQSLEPSDHGWAFHDDQA